MKVVKFGGSSMADAGQYRKVRDILLADPERRVVIVSAAGKRNKQDHKITDLLYLCFAHTQYGVDCSGVFEMITSRYREIIRDLGLTIDLEPEFAALKAKLDKKTITQDELASRGEYFSARLMADFLGFQFIDAADEADLNNAISNFRSKALYDTGVTAAYGDKLITLVTCAYHVEDGRFVVVARKK